MNKDNQEKVWDEIAESWDERRRDIGPRIIKFIQEAKGNFLDLGCGSGRNLIKNNQVEFYLVDFSQKMLDLAGKKAKKLKLKYKLIKTDASNLKCFEDNFFDSALYIATLHCLEKKEREKSLKEFFRVLKKKGKALISVWNTKHPAFKRFKNKKEILLAWTTGKNKEKRNLRYYYFYDEEEFIKDLKKIGFKVISLIDSKEHTGFIAMVEK
jgi:ubiquinone/menaquinone biosynthesis C-methylase UbiE